MLALIKGAKKTAVIMNAQDNVLPERRIIRLQEEIDNLTDLGLQPEELDLRDYFNKTNELRERLKQFDYLWVRGGNVFLLRRAYRQSGFDSLLVELLRNDAVAYGGYSAGICILSPSLRGLELVDPKDIVSESYDETVIWDGLGILDYMIAPHYKSNHPESTDIDLSINYFEYNYIQYKTLRDGEAVVIDGDEEFIVSQ